MQWTKAFKYIGILGGLISFSTCIYVILNVFASLKLAFPMEVLSVPEPAKSFISLYAILAAFTLIFSLTSFPKSNFAGFCIFSSSIVSLIAIFSPNLYGFKIGIEIATLSLGFILSLISGVYIILKTPKPIFGKPFFSALEISVTAILSALQAFLTASVGAIFPSPTGGYTHIGDTITFLSAFLFGPKIAMFTGIIGSLAADFYLAYPRWYVSILAHGAEGLISGLSYGRSIPVKVILSLIAGFSMAFTYFYVNIFIKGYGPAIISLIRDFFGQALISLILALIMYKPLERALKSILRFPK